MPTRRTDFDLAAAEEIKAAGAAVRESGSAGWGRALLPGPDEGAVAKVDPSFVYLVMHEAFGPPNSATGNGYRVTWEWIIPTADGLLAVYDWKAGWWSLGYRGLVKPVSHPGGCRPGSAPGIRATIAPLHTAGGLNGYHQ
jgi:hypothetical protein